MNDMHDPIVEPLSVRIKQVQDATRGISEQYPRSYIRECIDKDVFPEDMWKAMGEFGLLGPVSYTHLTLPTICSV